MTFNLAVLSPNKADGYITKYPEIKTWYMAGHSLGGVVASTYAYKHHDSFTGLINLASYPNDDISSTELRMLNIYGSEDKVLEKENIMRVNLSGQLKQPNTLLKVVTTLILECMENKKVMVRLLLQMKNK